MKTNLSDSLFSLTAKANYHYYSVRRWYLSVNWLKLWVWLCLGVIGFTIAVWTFFNFVKLWN